ncbi:hypothetical protein TSMEX_002975 [Taenia solium]|eukprot:TsM_000378000 transcript=TsM_000378000 gene=TsM_000378000
MLALGWTIDPSGACREDDATGLRLLRRQFIHCRKRYRRPNHELIRYLQYWGYRLACKPTNQQAAATETTTTTTTTTAPNAIRQFAGEQGEGHPSSRFAYGLLSTLLDYGEGAMSTVREDKPSRVFSGH